MPFSERNPFANDLVPQRREGERKNIVKGMLGDAGLRALRSIERGRASRIIQSDRSVTIDPEREQLLKSFTEKEDRELVEGIYEREKEGLLYFFGEQIEVSPLPAMITPDRIRSWREQLFELHFLPKIRIKREGNYPGWRIRPEDTVFRDERFPDTAQYLPGAWLLVDGRDKPEAPEILDGDIEGYEDDIFVDVLEELRTDGVLSDFGRGSFRARLSGIELQKPVVRLACATILGINRLPGAHLRLPRGLEYNVLTNIHYRQWFMTELGEWFEDGYVLAGSNAQQLCGGGWMRGHPEQKMSTVYAGNKKASIGFRFVVEFPE